MSGTSDNLRVDPEDTINILVATDIHLGFDYNRKRGLCSGQYYFRHIN